MLSNCREWLAQSKERGMELGLKRVQEAHQALMLEAYQCTIIHVAGSNGKGTLCATLAAHFDSLDISTVMFTSPHLVRIEERIRFNGRPIDSHTFESYLNEIQMIESSLQFELTFFEITFLVSCLCAHRNNIDVFIVETGLGGRYDATRILPADIGVVTSLSLEHSDLLGETLAEIAAEKAAIARPGKPLIVRKVNDLEAVTAIEDEVMNAGQIAVDGFSESASLRWVNVTETDSIKQEAILLAKATLDALNVDASGIETSANALNWPGRFQKIPTHWNGTVLFDAAHNPSGLNKIQPELQHAIHQHESWSLLFGCTPQQNLPSFSKPLIDLCQQNPPTNIILTKPQYGRHPGVSLDELRELDWPPESIITECEDAGESYRRMEEFRDSFSIAIGSLYLVGEMFDVMGLWGSKYMELFPAKAQRDEA